MKLRNKKTGEIKEYGSVGATTFGEGGVLEGFTVYNSLAELNEDWEDYEEPKEYWFIYGNQVLKNECDDVMEDRFKEIGNYFETKEEAELALRKLKVWKRLKDNGFKIKGWKFTPDMKQIQGNYVKIEAEIPQILINEKDLDLLFCAEENN